MEPLPEIFGLKPQTRARSYTWPLSQQDNHTEQNYATVNQCEDLFPNPSTPSISVKKNSSRRNAWGNLSYADLITQALTSSTDKRLTLAQIYKWMVQNVSYFNDKGSGKNSTTWKNSVRHTLSLNNKFKRVENDGTIKSSWWTINPDAKPGNCVRRRAVSMGTGEFEKRRGRVKKKVNELPKVTTSPSEGRTLSICSSLPKASGFGLNSDLQPKRLPNTFSGGRLLSVSSVPEVSACESGSISFTDHLGMDFNYFPDQLAENFEQGTSQQPQQLIQEIPACSAAQSDMFSLDSLSFPLSCFSDIIDIY